MRVSDINSIETVRIPRNIYLQTEMIMVFTTKRKVKGEL